MNKHVLPNVAEFPFTIDFNKVNEYFLTIKDKFIDVRSANPMLCMNHEELVKDVYDNFEQINLTNPSKILPYTENIKERLKRQEEHLYNVATPFFKDTWLENNLKKLFKAPVSRIRITKLSAGKTIPFHVDYNVDYAVRCIYPIETDKNVKNLFKRKNKIEEYNLKAGKIYFLNVGFPHSVVNDSLNDRTALMFSLKGTEDLNFLQNNLCP